MTTFICSVLIGSPLATSASMKARYSRSLLLSPFSSRWRGSRHRPASTAFCQRSSWALPASESESLAFAFDSPDDADAVFAFDCVSGWTWRFGDAVVLLAFVAGFDAFVSCFFVVRFLVFVAAMVLPFD